MRFVFTFSVGLFTGADVRVKEEIRVSKLCMRSLAPHGKPIYTRNPAQSTRTLLTHTHTHIGLITFGLIRFAHTEAEHPTDRHNTTFRHRQTYKTHSSTNMCCRNVGQKKREGGFKSKRRPLSYPPNILAEKSVEYAGLTINVNIFLIFGKFQVANDACHNFMSIRS